MDYSLRFAEMLVLSLLIARNSKLLIKYLKRESCLLTSPSIMAMSGFSFSVAETLDSYSANPNILLSQKNEPWYELLDS